MKRLFAVLLTFLLAFAPAFASSYGRIQIDNTSKVSYVASSALVTPAAATTDIFQLYGSATKTVKVQRIEAVYAASAFGSDPSQLFILKRSTANSGGTATTLTGLALDSSNSAATATSIKIYTANPTPGTLAGQIKIMRISCQIAGNGSAPPSAGPPIHVLYDASSTTQPIVLRGTSQGVVINFNGVIPQATSAQLAFNIYWTEE